jgi:hypothetical protein
MVAGLGLQLQHQLQSLPRCCIPHQQQQQRPRCMPARYQPSSRDLEQLFQEAQQGPQVTGWPPTQQHQHSPSSSPTRLPDMRLRPSQMDFPTMYTQLQAWQARHLSAHVPHHCFDAPELGAWVRHMRKQRKDGRLEQWKVDRCAWVSAAYPRVVVLGSAAFQAAAESCVVLPSP